MRYASLSAQDDVMSDADPTAGWSKSLRKETGRQESRTCPVAPVNAPPQGAAGHQHHCRRKQRHPPLKHESHRLSRVRFVPFAGAALRFDALVGG